MTWNKLPYLTDVHAAITIHADLDTNLLALAAQQLDLDTQAVNLVFAGPVAAGPSKPTFRSMVAADLPVEAIVDADFAAGEGFMRKTGAGTYIAHKSNLASAANPGVNDDLAAGYSVGSVWINITLDKVWQCVDSTNGAAVWKWLSHSSTIIVDADADTKVDVEEGADDDTVRIDLGGGAPVADAIVMTAAGGLISKISIIPSVDSAVDLGSSTPKYFRAAYIDKIYLNSTANLDGVTAGRVKITGDPVLLANIIRDSADTARITLAAALPNIAFTGNVTVTGTVNTAVMAYGIYNEVVQQGVGQFVGMLGNAKSTGGNAATALIGVWFAAVHSGAASIDSLQGAHVAIRFDAAGGAAWAYGMLLVPDYVGAGKPTVVYGMHIANFGAAGIAAAIGLHIDDQVGAGTNYLLDIGPGTPYLRLVGGAAPAAGLTNLWLYEGTTPALRNVAFANTDATGHVTPGAVKKVLYLV